MEQERKVDSVGYDCKSHEKQEPDCEFIGKVYDGVSAMRDSNDFLKPLFREGDDDYAKRKAHSEFYNVTKGTIDHVVGSVFADGLVSTEELPDAVKSMFQDIDLCGNDIETFLRETFTNAVRDGHSFIFVDAPPKVQTDNATLADTIDQRPFWVNYKKDQAKNWQFDVIGGKTILSQITFEECVIEKDGVFGEKEVERRRVLRVGSFELWEKQQDKRTKEEKWKMIDEGETGLQEIPIAVIYTNKKGLLESIPPYIDLAKTNIKHYNCLSKLDYTLDFVAPKPIIHVNDDKDAEKFKKLDATPSRSLIIWGEFADAKYLELEGKSIDALLSRINSAEMRMAKQGAEKYAPIKDLSNKTATEVSTDNQKEFSQVAIMAKNLEDAVELALYYTGLQFEVIQGANTIVKIKTKYGQVSDGIEVQLNIAYEKLTYSTEQLNFIKGLRATGDLSQKTFLKWLPFLMDLPNDFNPEQEYILIQNERAQKMKEEMQMRPNMG